MAGSKTLSIDLRVRPADTPRYVCIVQTNVTPTSHAKKLSSLSKDVSSSGTSSARDESAFDGTLERLRPRAERGTVTWTVAPVTEWSSLDRDDDSPELRAFRVLAQRGECDSDLCTPRFSVRAEQWVQAGTRIQMPSYVQCESNTQQVSGPPRVLIIGLHYRPHGSRALDFFDLDGSVVNVNLDRAMGDDEYAIGTVLGGDYESGETERSAGGRLQLPLHPRCYQRDLTVPPVIGANHTSIRYGLCPAKSSCTRGWVNTLRVNLPGGAAGEQKRFRVRVEDGDPPPGDDDLGCEAQEMPPTGVADLSYEWTADVPPETLAPEVETLVFRWAPSCRYPRRGEVCPDVRIEGHSTSCSSRLVKSDGADQCVYRCGPSRSARAPFPLPATAVFSTDLVFDAWREQIAALNARLTGFAPPASHPLLVTFSKWKDLAPRAFNRMAGVELRGSGGTTYVVGLRQGQAVTFPEASCGASIRYRISGDLEYREGVAEVAEGHIDIPPPEATVIDMYPGAFVNVGYVIDGPFASDRGSGSVGPMVGVDLVELDRGQDDYWGWEVSVGAYLSSYPWYGLPSSGSVPALHRGTDLKVLMGVGLNAAGTTKTPGLQGGLIFARFGLTNSLNGNVPSSLSWEPAFYVRAPFTRRTWFQFELGLSLPQMFRTYSMDPTGTPQQSTITGFGGITTLGVGVFP